MPAWLSPWRPHSVANRVHEDMSYCSFEHVAPERPPIIRTLIIFMNFFGREAHLRYERFRETAVTFSVHTYSRRVDETISALISVARTCRKWREMA